MQWSCVTIPPLYHSTSFNTFNQNKSKSCVIIISYHLTQTEKIELMSWCQWWEHSHHVILHNTTPSQSNVAAWGKSISNSTRYCYLLLILGDSLSYTPAEDKYLRFTLHHRTCERLYMQIPFIESHHTILYVVVWHDLILHFIYFNTHWDAQNLQTTL